MVDGRLVNPSVNHPIVISAITSGGDLLNLGLRMRHPSEHINLRIGIDETRFKGSVQVTKF